MLPEKQLVVAVNNLFQALCHVTDFACSEIIWRPGSPVGARKRELGIYFVQFRSLLHNTVNYIFS